MNFSLQPVTKPILLNLDVISNLKIQPEALAHAEEMRQAKRSISAYRPLSMNDLVDTTSWYPDFFGKPILAQAHRLQKLLKEDFSGMYGWKLLAHVAVPSGHP